MGNVLPIVIFNDSPPSAYLAEFCISRTSNPIGIGKLVEDGLSNGGGDAIVLLLRSFGHELHTLCQRTSRSRRFFRPIGYSGFRGKGLREAGKNRLTHRRNFIRAASGSLPKCSPISDQLSPSRTYFNILLTSICPASSSCSPREL